MFCGLIYRDSSIYEKIKFSLIDLESEEIPFDLTDYYEREMKSPLFKRFFSFIDLIDPEQLAEIKIYTNSIEQENLIAGQRNINIDPGYMSESNVIIATTKNYYHRIPLRKGIYAHIEYVIRKKNIVTLDWTYPDFKKPEYLLFFNILVKKYKEILRNQ